MSMPPHVRMKLVVRGYRLLAEASRALVARDMRGYIVALLGVEMCNAALAGEINVEGLPEPPVAPK